MNSSPKYQIELVTDPKLFYDPRHLTAFNELLRQLNVDGEQATAPQLEKLVRHHSLFVAWSQAFEPPHTLMIVGSVSLYIQHLATKTGGCIENVIVHEGYRRLGICTNLLRRAYDSARMHDAKVLYLTSSDRRREAHQLYEAFGFEIYRTNEFFMEVK